MKITKHGEERIKERVCKKSNAVAKKALLEGISHNETSGSLNRFLTSLFMNGKNANNIKIYGRTVYLFCNDILITVIPLPKKYYKTCDKIKERKHV